MKMLILALSFFASSAFAIPDVLEWNCNGLVTALDPQIHLIAHWKTIFHTANNPKELPVKIFTAANHVDYSTAVGVGSMVSRGDGSYDLTYQANGDTFIGNIYVAGPVENPGNPKQEYGFILEAHRDVPGSPTLKGLFTCELAK